MAHDLFIEGGGFRRGDRVTRRGKEEAESRLDEKRRGYKKTTLREH